MCQHQKPLAANLRYEGDLRYARISDRLEATTFALFSDLLAALFLLGSAQLCWRCLRAFSLYKKMIGSVVVKVEPIRILNLFTNMNRGGAESMVMSHYRVLDHRLIQFDFLVHRQERGAFEDEIEALGGRIFRVPAITLRNIPEYRRRLAVFFDQHPEYRIIHGHMSELGYFAYKTAAQYGVPVRISHAHGCPLNFDAKSIPRHILKWLCKGHITHMFACSQKAGEWLFGKNNRNHLTLMRNAINCSQFAFSSTRRDALRARMDLDGRFIVGHIGRFEIEKNHTFLLDIFADLVNKEPSAVLLLVGDGPLRSTMEIKAGGLGIADRVRFLGVRSDIPELLQAMDVFAFPSLFEGFGIVALEAQAAGLPCLLSDTIPPECAVIEDVNFLSLAVGTDKWVDEILKQHGAKRQLDAARRVAQAGYDVKENARWLTRFYLDEYQK